ncbi:MAG: hypothetical protein IKX33_09710 [Prevotella sp.]|nr:hypothetical protein [Prevotella sp.]
MKKLMIVALMAIVATTAFAGDSPTLKSILKAKTYAEAESLLKSGLNQLASPAEKAKAYNKLVDLALDKFTKEQAIQTSNQMAEQYGQGKVQQFDTLGMYNAVAQAFAAAEECEKYDVMPDAKGKVKPVFHAKNVQRLIGHRLHLINGGIFFQDKKDITNAFNLLSMYVDSHDSPLFAEEAAKTPDENLTNMAYYAALFAYQNKDYDNVKKYANIAKADEKLSHDAINLKNAAIQSTLQTRQDSINYVKVLEQEYAEDSSDELSFGMLLNMYTSLGMDKEMKDAVEKKLAEDPENYTAWAVKGQTAMNEQNFDEAITCFKNAIKQQENPVVLTYLAACLLDKGGAVEDRQSSKGGGLPQAAKDQIRPLYEEAKGYLERAQIADPDQTQSRWSYLLETCNYRIDSMK